MQRPNIARTCLACLQWKLMFYMCSTLIDARTPCSTSCHCWTTPGTDVHGLHFMRSRQGEIMVHLRTELISAALMAYAWIFGWWTVNVLLFKSLVRLFGRFLNLIVQPELYVFLDRERYSLSLPLSIDSPTAPIPWYVLSTVTLVRPQCDSIQVEAYDLCSCINGMILTASRKSHQHNKSHRLHRLLDEKSLVGYCHSSCHVSSWPALHIWMHNFRNLLQRWCSNYCYTL